MEQRKAARPPTSFWVVGIMSLIWNAFGGVDYTMTRLRNAEYLSSAGDPQVILAWIDGFPLWAQAAWGLGVWGSVAGSVLLLARSRHAVTAFGLSLLGAVLSLGFQLTHAVPAELDTTSGKAMPVLIILIVAFLLRFAYVERAKGTLR
ncbi:MAG: hypothetical protein IPG83_13845 [Novosphingobium sp.]|nr:hypothetical protein [Novosphingobium sp.]